MDVSVIVPTYNRADIICETLDSILAQTYKPYEVIVVDDGSTDHTEVVVRNHAPAVRYMWIRNSGECAARNAGVLASSGQLVAFCDSDDLWRENKLELQVQLFERLTDLQYSFTNFKTVFNDCWSTEAKFDTSPCGYWELPIRRVGHNSFVVDASMFRKLLQHQPIFPSTLMMKRSFFEAVGRWSEPLGRTRSVDLEFHLRCVRRPPIGVVSAPVVGIRKHAANFSGDPLINAIGEIEVLKYVLEHHSLSAEDRNAVREEIVARSASAAAQAFESGDMQKTRRLLAVVPWARRSWKLSMKGLIAKIPGPASRVLRHISITCATAITSRVQQGS